VGAVETCILTSFRFNVEFTPFDEILHKQVDSLQRSGALSAEVLREGNESMSVIIDVILNNFIINNLLVF